MDFWAMATISAGVCWTWGEFAGRGSDVFSTLDAWASTHMGSPHPLQPAHALRAFMRVDAASKTRRAPAVQGAASSGARWRQWPFPQGQVQEGTSSRPRCSRALVELPYL